MGEGLSDCPVLPAGFPFPCRCPEAPALQPARHRQLLDPRVPPQPLPCSYFPRPGFAYLRKCVADDGAVLVREELGALGLWRLPGSLAL
ncbi:hypothetical protein H8959_011610, partial [Pygathrix nigripes]